VTLAAFADHATTREAGAAPGGQVDRFHRRQRTFGNWLLDHCRQAQVYAELAGVNNIVIDSTDAYKAMLRNLAFTLALYSGQMCTTSQAIFVPADGIETDDGHKSFDEVAQRPRRGHRPASCSANPRSRTPYSAPYSRRKRCSASQRSEQRRARRGRPRTQQARAPRLPEREVRTPVLLACDAADEAGTWRRSASGRSVFIVKVADTAAAIALSGRVVATHGALTAGVYSTSARGHRGDD
jgi:acyl-CoA reductase-like NAD-dependent aldehyde dehydrogenase